MLSQANKSVTWIRKVMPSVRKEVVTPLNQILHETVYKIPCTILVHFVPERVIHPLTAARSGTSTIRRKEGDLLETKSAVLLYMKGLH